MSRSAAPMSCKLFFMLIFSIGGCMVYGQALDSLWGVLRKHSKKDTAYVNDLLNLQGKYLYYHTDSSIMLGMEALQLSQKLQHQVGLVDGYHYLGIGFAIKGDLNKAEEYVQRAITLGEKWNFQQKALDALSSVAAMHGIRREYVKAKEAFLRTYSKADSLQDNLLKCFALLGISAIYLSIGDYDQAYLHFDKCIKLAAVTEGCAEAEGDALEGMGKTFFAKNNFAKADSCFRLSIRKREKIQERVGVASTLIQLTFNHLKLDSIAEAKASLLKAERMAHEFRFDNEQREVNKAWGIVYMKGNQPQEALRHFKKVLPAFDRDKIQHFDVYEYVAKVYNQLGEHKLASIYLDSAYTIRNQFLDEGVVRNLITIQHEYDVTFRERQLIDLSLEGKVNDLALANEQKANYLLIGSIVMLGIIAGMLIIGFRMKAKLSAELQEKYEEVRVQNEMIEAINKDLRDQAIRAQVNPNFVFHCLSSIQYLITNGKTEAAIRCVSIFSQLLRNILEYSDRQWITVLEEIEMLKFYVELESLRFDDFEFQIFLSEDSKGHEKDLIPSMIVQPFVENLILSGQGMNDGRKRLGVEFSKNDYGKLVCSVTNNQMRDGLTEMQVSDGNAIRKSESLKLTEQRLQLLGGKAQSRSHIEIVGLIDNDKSVVGTKVTVEFPVG